MRLESGTAIGRYVLFDLLGEGSMGAVFRAWDDALDRIVALKVLLPSEREVDKAKDRFLQEARLAARINHPAVAHIYDVGEHEGTPYISMEFVPGRQLRQDMDGGRVRPERAVFLARQILDGLGEAHRMGVVHRDLKPENILLSGRDQVKILDFGLAKPMFKDPRIRLDSSVGITGTPRYMAPEQFEGKAVDGRTDLYALGVVLYELLAGVPAHPAKSIAGLVQQVLRPEPPQLDLADLPEGLDAVVRRAMARARDERYESAEAMQEALRPLAGTGYESVESELPSGPYLPHPRAAAYAQRARDALVGFGEEPSRLALEMSQKAIELDPKFALAHALHAEACALSFMHGRGDAALLDQAESSFGRAEALDRTLPDTMLARSRILWNKTFNFPAETAMRELLRALRIDPNHAGALRMWANVTGHLGLFDLMDVAIRRRLAADPHDQIMLLLQAGLHIQRGDPARAIEELSETTRLDPDQEDVLFWWLLAHAKLLDGDADGCKEITARTLVRCSEDPVIYALAALAHAVAGDETRARELASEAYGRVKSETHPHHAFHHLACMESVLGEAEASLEWLSRAANEGFPCWPWFDVDPMLEHLRNSPVGKAFLRELKRRYDFYAREFRVDI